MTRQESDKAHPPQSMRVPAPSALSELEESGPAATCHGSVVAVRGRGLLITGPSGVGKSRLAMEMIALGAHLVADDAVKLRRRGASVMVSSPAPTRGMIEARGIGLLSCPAAGEVPLTAIYDLGTVEEARLPPWRHISLLGCSLPLILGPKEGHAAPALILYMTYGRRA